MMRAVEKKNTIHEKKDINNYLDHDSLAKIFMLLPIPERIMMKQVCSKWKEACQLAWYDIKKYKCGKSIGRPYNNRLLTESYVQKILLNFGIYLNELSLSDVCKSSIIPIVGDCCKNLTRLEFVFDGRSKSHNTNNYVQAFTQLEKLEYIKIQVITVNKEHHSNFPMEIIDSLLDGMKEIHLLFTSSSQEKEPIFFNLNKFTLLNSLTMSFCNVDRMIEDITEKTTLVYLDIADSWVSETRKSWPMFNNLVNLEYFQFKDEGYSDRSPAITTDGILSILNTCKNLKHFEGPDFPMNRSLNHKLVKWVNLENLVYFNISNMYTELAEHIVQYCRKLKYLIIRGDDSISPAALIKVTQLENLEWLEVLSCDLNDDRALVAISMCRKLKHLEIPWVILQINNPMSSLVTCSYIHLSNLQYLEHLDLSRNSFVTNNSIVAIARNCKNLKHLNIESCMTSQTGLDALKSMENLQDLSITANYFVTDDFIVKLKGFKRLNFSDCHNITDAGIIELIKNCPDLEQLQIQCVKVTQDTIIAADELTRNRINDVTLRLCIFDDAFQKSAESKIKSQWLSIKRFKKIILD